MNKLSPDEVRRVKLLAVAMRDAFQLSVEMGDEHGAAFGEQRSHAIAHSVLPAALG